MRFTVEGRMPSLNDYIRANRNSFQAGNRMRSQYEREVSMAIREAHLKPVREYPVEIGITWYEPDRRRDVDNITWAVKFILDPLVRQGILVDDSQKYVTKIRNEIRVDRKHPHIVIYIGKEKGREMRESFVFYASFYEAISDLKMNQQVDLYRAICEYALYGNEVKLTGIETTLFKVIKPQLTANISRREGGRKGGRPRKEKAKASDTENDNGKEKKTNGYENKKPKVYEDDKSNESDDSKPKVFEDENQWLGEKKPNVNVNDNVNVNVNDNVNVNVNDNANATANVNGGGFEKEKTEFSENSPVSPGSESGGCPYSLIVDGYNSVTGLPKVKKITEDRKKHIRARWKEYGEDMNAFDELFQKAGSSRFLHGGNDRGWHADFDWLMNQANMAKVLEDRYADDDDQEDISFADEGIEDRSEEFNELFEQLKKGEI